MHTYIYPRPAVTVDAVVFSYGGTEPEVLLIQRKNEPFKGCWAFPGGFVDEQEDLKDAALRELQEETSIDRVQLQQFRAYGTPNRDPRGHTVSIVFTGEGDRETLEVKALDDAASIGWFKVSSLPSLAFDHGQVLEDVLREFEANKLEGK